MACGTRNSENVEQPIDGNKGFDIGNELANLSQSLNTYLIQQPSRGQLLGTIHRHRLPRDLESSRSLFAISNRRPAIAGSFYALKFPSNTTGVPQS